LFAIVAVPFDAYAALPRSEHRWLLTCFSRYVDRAGKAFPSLRQLARDARMSLASVSRYMTVMERLGCFTRERKPGGRYLYQLAEAYRPRWPGRPKPAVPAPQPSVPQTETQQAKPEKNLREKGRFAGSPDDSAQWRARLTAWRNSGGRFWPSFAGPRPDEPGCFAPPALVQAVL
jgi:DNA-binding transcriptional MocR family regulator